MPGVVLAFQHYHIHTQRQLNEQVVVYNYGISTVSL